MTVQDAARFDDPKDAPTAAVPTPDQPAPREASAFDRERAERYGISTEKYMSSAPKWVKREGVTT